MKWPKGIIVYRVQNMYEWPTRYMRDAVDTGVIHEQY